MDSPAPTAHRGKRMSDAAFTQLWNRSDLKVRHIADMLGISVKSVYARAYARGLKRRSAPAHPLSDRTQDMKSDPQFKELWARGVPGSALAQHYGTSERTVARYAASIGLKPHACNRPLEERPTVMIALMWIEADKAKKRWRERTRG